MTWERRVFDKTLAHVAGNVLVSVQDGELVIKDFESYYIDDRGFNHSHEIPLSDLTWLLHINEAANDTK